MFEARIDRDGVVWLSGELDLASADRFSEVASTALDGQREFVVDLSGLSFLDSTGIRAMLALAARTDRGVVLRDPPPNVRRILEITAVGGHSGIRIEPSS
jgi:anti-anti-sigma factor